MVKQLLPRIYQILCELNRRLCAKLWNYFPGEWERIGSMAIISYNQIHMANLCIAMSFSINGVSKLHGEILKEDTFHDYASIMRRSSPPSPTALHTAAGSWAATPS